MFGLTKREQRWKAEQKAAETIAGVLVAAVNAKSHKGEEMNKSEQLIACLEGEIAKRDETIARLEQQLNRSIQVNYDLRAELSALKAQVPVAWVGTIEDGVPLLVVEPQNWKATPLYAAPVSEAKEQGVVMPDVNAAAKALCNRHAMICGVDADDQWKEYGQDFIADAETVLANARLNAAPVQQVSVPDDAGKSVRHALEAAHSAIVYRGKSTPFEYALKQLTIALRLTTPKDACDE